MELQLGLALPVHGKGVTLDLNAEGCDWESKCGYAESKKRGFDEAFGDLPKLLVWDGQPNDDGGGKGRKFNDSCPINIDTDEENYIIGWPPIKSSRKKELGHRHHVEIINKRPTAKIKINAASPSSSSSSTSTAMTNYNSMYVKVKMEGFAIARKVDLSLHQSYHTLKHALIAMFFNNDQECTKDIEESYTLGYQDKEGDCLLAGDVPWKNFVKSVQRLEIVRNK